MARRALGPSTLKVVQAVEATLEEGDIALLVACSGGADSLALAAAAHFVARKQGRTVAAVVVDHGLQTASAAVADRARRQLSDLGYYDATIVTVGVELGAGSGVEAAARAARYRALTDAAEVRGAIVLLGHTCDDQAETVLLGLARGSGIRSLAGMAVRRNRLVRPLLGLARVDTEAACHELGLEPWQDPHNSDPAYARSRVRHRVLPLLEAELGPGIADALARTARLAREDADLLDQLADQADPGTETLDCDRLTDLPAAIRRRVIRRWLVRCGAGETTLGQVAGVEDLVVQWRGQRGLDLPGLTVTRRVGQLHARQR